MKKIVAAIIIGYYLGRPVKKDGVIDKAVSKAAQNAGHALGGFISKKVDKALRPRGYVRYDR